MEIELDSDITFKIFQPELRNEFPIEDSSITYSEFFEKYQLKNQACLIKNASCNWKSAKLWVQNDLPNFTYLKSKYGETCVTTQDGDARNNWVFCDYLEYWNYFIQDGYPKDKPLHYLKDWHLKNESPDDDFYEVPLHFASDWLNEFLTAFSLDDYRFVYMGVKGTGSPFHVDVMTSYSWSANLCGQKRWILFPPGEEDYLCDHLNNLPDDITKLKHTRRFFEVFQGPGDAMFVPSNWHHQVWNTKDTISINHNWINGCNLANVWCSMEKNLCEVKHEIRDCIDMENFLDHCQLMLKASFCFDFVRFYDFMEYIACKRLDLIEKGTEVILADNRKLGKNHALFDLQSIRHTLTLFAEHEDIEKLTSFKNVKVLPKTMLHYIEEVLDDYGS